MPQPTLEEGLNHRKEVWVRHFRKEGYPEISKTVEQASEKHGSKRLTEKAFKEFLIKTHVTDNKSRVYVETMQEDMQDKLERFGEIKDKLVSKKGGK